MPIPASPDISMDRAIAAFYLLPAAITKSISSSRPSNEVLATRKASKRLSTALVPTTRQAGTRLLKPVMDTLPRARESTDEAAEAVDDHRIRLGQRLKPRGQIGGRPTTPDVPGDAPSPMSITTITKPAAMPTRARNLASGPALKGCDQCQPGAYRALSIVFIRPRIAGGCEHAVADVSGTRSAKLLDLLGTAAVVRANDFPQVLRVEPCSEAQSSQQDRRTSPPADVSWPRPEE